MAKQEPFWMISPSLIRLLGAEYHLMQKSGGTVLRRFYISSVLIILIMVTSFLSIHYAVTLLFHIPIVEILTSILLSVLFVFIYILLINTFPKEKNVAKKYLFNFSNIIRISFVMFMAFLLSKPIEIYFFKDLLNNDVKRYTIRLINEHTKKIDKIFIDDLAGFQKRKLNLEYEIKKHSSAFIGLEINVLTAKIDSIENKKLEMSVMMQQKIQASSFFIYRVKQVNKEYHLSWLICIIIIVLFILPGFLIYSISVNNSYFQLKKTYENEMIEKEYYAFSEKYTSLFQNIYGLPLQFYTKYEDPPFNTIPKKDNEYNPPKDFLNKYCPD